MTIVPNEVERVRYFVRGLTFSIGFYVFREAREWASVQSTVSTTKEAELIVLEEFRETKRDRSSGKFFGASSRSRG
ncbi:hypothetical protein R3W88_024266 [Solanum pinnatisectum]|uniref:Uncharacterized protein n=1 Tax=Solanum pinnatisectum TaxID=50273 RepID=A0AAV9M0N7_9SOLN|nr:hypothetical protein R3W88_024266 [Solanum pinnatisectum]